MGRPPLPKDQKRQQVNIRLDPTDRAHLEVMAARDGMALASAAETSLSFAIEVDRQAGAAGPGPERRAAMNWLLANDDETLQFLAEVTMEIKMIESMTRKRWHKSRRTWAAVAQMLSQGPTRWHRVDDPNDDEAFKNAALDGWAIRALKRRKVREIALLGVVVSADANGLSATNALASVSRGIASPNALYPGRSYERRIIDALPDPKSRLAAQLLFDEVVELDEQELQNDLKVAELIQPYMEEEHIGRKLYADHRRSIAEAAKDAGEPYYYEDLR